MDFQNTLIRCSSLGKLMTEPRTKADKEAGNLSETAKAHLIDVYVQTKYGRKQDISNQYINKGLMVEEDSITLYSRLKKVLFQKNTYTLSDDYIKGTPDLFVGDDIKSAQIIIDIKSSWDLFTFFRTATKEINSDYWWQLQGYMALTGAQSSRLAYCLVDTPELLINDEKRRLMYKMNVISDHDANYESACKELEFSMTYGDIPLQERLIEFEIPRDDESISAIPTKVERAREFLRQMDELFPIN